MFMDIDIINLNKKVEALPPTYNPNNGWFGE